MEQSEQPSSLFEMEMDGNTQGDMLTISQWTRTISITAFICLVVFSIALIVSYQGLPGFSNPLLSGGIIVLALVVVFLTIWMFFLFKASRMIRDGIFNRDNAALAEGFRALRVFFVFSLIGSVLSAISTILSLLEF
jgi:hypothetical protein